MQARRGEGAGPGARRWARWVPTHRCLSAPAASFLAAAASAIGHEASRPARGGGEGGFAFSYFKSQKTLLALLLQDLGPWWAPSAFAGRGGAPEEVQASVRPREGARGHSRPILDWMGWLSRATFPHRREPEHHFRRNEQLGGRAGPEQGQGRGRAVRGRARAVRASRQEAAPAVHAPGCAHHRPALHPCSRLQRWCPCNSRQGSHPPGACSCARRGS